jgi:hypothetical protein
MSFLFQTVDRLGSDMPSWTQTTIALLYKTHRFCGNAWWKPVCRQGAFFVANQPFET